MANIETLPSELIEDICYCLAGKDLKEFRLVNKAISDISERCFWDTQTLVLNLNREQLCIGMGMLEDLKNRCRVSGLVRTMMIESLAPQRATRYEQPKDYKAFEGI
ncbi:hypothetical protein AAF712_004554 [Marasmius tenuissimus]|uniref:F-box domain-containing protein n=1 Tax=Marasmius tenuissimus TaxID=585030 RepID=A0ABR3A558_9AGAR|nr:hypothetical protein PM082_003752 [Marasmius tenuissimus]